MSGNRNPDTIKANLLKVGDEVLMSLYSCPDSWVTVRVISRPDCSIRTMKPSDEFVVRDVETEEEFRFRKNKTEPFYLVTDIPSPNRPGTTKLDRVRFWVVDRIPGTAKSKES